MSLKEKKKYNKKEFINLLKPYKYYVILLILISLISSLLDGISAGMLVPILSSLQQVQNYDQLPKLLRIVAEFFSGFSIDQQLILSILFIVAAVLLKNLFLAFSMYLGTWLSSKVSADLKSQGIDLLMSVGIEFYQKRNAGDLGRLLSYAGAAEHLIVLLTKCATQLASFVVLFVMLLILSWQLTLLTVLFAVFIAKAVSFYVKRLTRAGEESAILGRELSSSFHESISGIEVIKAFVKERVQAVLLKDQIEQHRKVSQHINFSRNLIRLITDCLGIIAIAIIFLSALLLYGENRNLIIIQLIPFFYIVTRIMPTVKFLNETRGRLTSQMPSLKMVYELLRTDNKPFMQNGTKMFTGLKFGIRFNDVMFTYHNQDSLALTNVKFDIPKGKITAIVGESGAGKSTIVKLLLRFHDPQQGSVQIDGETLTHYQLESYRAKIGMVSQDTFIFNDTVRNNIAFGAQGEPSERDIREVAKKAGAHDFIVSLTEGYDTILGDRGIRLSGGQRQRISIARAILKDPEILILDEAMSSLDTKAEKWIHDAIVALSLDRTVIIISHRLSAVKGADQIVVLKQGQVAEIGNAAQLLEKQGEFYNLARVSDA